MACRQSMGLLTQYVFTPRRSSSVVYSFTYTFRPALRTCNAGIMLCMHKHKHIQTCQMMPDDAER